MMIAGVLGQPEGCEELAVGLEPGTDFRCLRPDPLIGRGEPRCEPLTPAAAQAFEQLLGALLRLDAAKFPDRQPWGPLVKAAASGRITTGAVQRLQRLIEPDLSTRRCDRGLPDDSCACHYQSQMDFVGASGMGLEMVARHAAQYARWIDIYRKAIAPPGGVPQPGAGAKGMGKLGKLGVMTGVAILGTGILWVLIGDR